MKNNEKIQKIAHQIGTQGYALMNDRAFCNCQKIKSEKKDSPWESWNECWEEYKKAYNSEPDKWLGKYLSSEENKKVQASENIKKIIKENFVKDVEEAKGDSKFVGASIRNVLRHYAVEELKEKLEK